MFWQYPEAHRQHKHLVLSIFCSGPLTLPGKNTVTRARLAEKGPALTNKRAASEVFVFQTHSKIVPPQPSCTEARAVSTHLCISGSLQNLTQTKSFVSPRRCFCEWTAETEAKCIQRNFTAVTETCFSWSETRMNWPYLHLIRTSSCPVHCLFPLTRLGRSPTTMEDASPRVAVNSQGVVKQNWRMPQVHSVIMFSINKGC